MLRQEQTIYGDTSILVAEARVLRDGLRLTIQVGFKHIAIEGDNKIMIQALKENIQILWKIFIKYINIWQTQGIHLRTYHLHFQESKCDS